MNYRKRLKEVDVLIAEYKKTRCKDALGSILSYGVQKAMLIRKILGMTTLNDGNNLYIYSDSNKTHLVATLFKYKKHLLIESKNHITKDSIKTLQAIVKSV